MIKIDRFVIGIRPASKMFRVQSLGGVLIDAILAERGSGLAEEYYTNVSTNLTQGTFSLQNKTQGNSLKVDLSNIIFSKDVYDSDKHINLDEACNEFIIVWKSLNSLLDLRDIRRIGIVAEHQIRQDGNTNSKLIQSLTKFSAPAHPAKFHLRYEERRPTREGLAPDIDKSDFVNVIYEYYDSSIDADHAIPGAINANIDIQRYYAPLLKGNVSEEVTKLRKFFQDEKKKFETALKDKEVIN